MCACEMASYLAACIHLNGALWPWRPHPDTDTSMSLHTPEFLWSRFVFPILSHAVLVMGSHSLIFLFFADWSGKWHSPLLLQPIQFKVKWCVLCEMSFCTLLLYSAVIYSWPVNVSKFCHSLPTSWGLSLLRLSFIFHCVSFVVNCSVKKKHGGFIFKGYYIWTNFRLIMGPVVCSLVWTPCTLSFFC